MTRQMETLTYNTKLQGMLAFKQISLPNYKYDIQARDVQIEQSNRIEIKALT